MASLTESGQGRRVMGLGMTVGVAALFLVLLLWAAGVGAPTAASPPPPAKGAVLENGSVITVGVAAALSPPVEDIGWRQLNAVQLAISETNAAGGLQIGGITYTLALVAADSACNPAQAITAANTLLDAGAVAVVGHTCSGASWAAQPLYSAAGVPMVSASSTVVGLTEGGYTTTFRVCSKDDAQAVLMATYFRGYLGMDAVALVEWSGLEPATDAFSDTFAGLGGTITGRYTLTSTEDYTATLTAIQPDDPDAVFYADYETARAGLFSSVADPLGLSVVGWNSGGDESALDGYAGAAGAAATGDYAGLNFRRLADMPGYDALDAAYQAAGFPNYGDEPLVWGAFAYDAAQIILDAMVRAGSVDPAAIRDAIAAAAGYHGVVGIYQGFDAQGDVIPQWAWLAHYWNGEWRALPAHRILLPVVLNN